MGRAYKVGTKVECLGNGETIDAGVWFPTRVLRKKGIDYLLEFEEGRQLFIPAHRVRPPQTKNTEIIKAGNSIDVFFNGGWHECTAVSCNNSFIEVSFHDCSEDTRKFKSSDVRIHRKFDGEYWMPKIEGWKPKLPDLSLEDPYPCLACPNSI